MSAPAGVLKIARVAGFGLLYLCAFVVFAYVSFPYERLKVYVVNQYNVSQGAEDSRLEIDSLDWSWRFPGVTASGVRLVVPPEENETTSAQLAASEVYLTTSLFGLLVGDRAASFGATALGGELEGSVDDSEKVRTLELALENVDLGLVPQVASAIGLPLRGNMTGTVEFAMPPGKINLAEGKIDIEMEDMVLGDGKAKIKNLIALPALNIGTFKLNAEITNGRVKFKECGASGGDLELSVGGGIRLRNRVEASVSDLEVKFQFSDRYKGKDEKTKLIFGDGKIPGLFESTTKEFLAKQEDGSFGTRLSGPFNRVRPRPLADRKARKKKARARKRRRKPNKSAREDSE